MRAKMARSATQPPFEVPGLRQSSAPPGGLVQKAEKAQKSTPVRGSSGESRLRKVETQKLRAVIAWRSKPCCSVHSALPPNAR
jgi:hypothetical protein